MEKKMMGLWVFVVVILAVSEKSRVYGITCAEALIDLSPCQGYLVGSDTSPSSSCCLAVDSLNKQATSREIRQQLCQCFKDQGPKIGVKPEKAKKLPELCKVSVPVPIDPSIDCKSIP